MIAQQWVGRWLSMRKGGVYLAFGDSISWTIPDDITASGYDLYAYKVWQQICKDYGMIRHLNRGYGGATSQNLKDYLDVLALGINYDLVTIQIGMNDCYNNSVPVATYISNVENVIDRLRTYRPNCEIILCKIPPTNDPARINNRGSYNSAIDTIVTDKNVKVADFSNAFDPNDTTICGGVHPKIPGHQLLFNILYPVVQTTNFVKNI